jgi:hypothetical protein
VVSSCWKFLVFPIDLVPGVTNTTPPVWGSVVESMCISFEIVVEWCTVVVDGVLKKIFSMVLV